MRKLFIKENVITDMRDKGIINSKRVGDYLNNNYSYSVNLQDCKLVPISPRSYMTAKRNPNPIIGVADGRIWGGYNEKDLEGPMIYGLYGKDMFTSFHNYYDKIRDNFAKCAEFYEIVPIDEDSYKTANQIRKDRDITAKASIDDKGNLDYYNYDKSPNKTRILTQADIDSYNPSVNRRRYKDILTKNHLNNYAKEYDTLCNEFSAFKDRFRDVDIKSVGYGFNSILRAFGDFVEAVSRLDNAIENINKDVYWKSDEEDLKAKVRDAKDKAKALDNVLTSKGV
jgi:hypothetical protein